MELVMTIIYGGIIGWLASLVMKTDAQQGLVANVVIGVIGSVIGRFLYNAVFNNTTDSFLGNLIVSVIGAAIVIYVWQMATKKPAA